MWKLLTRASILTLATATSLGATPEAWTLLNSVEIREVEDEAGVWHVEKEFPPALLAAEEDFLITGHLVRITAEPRLTEFLLVPNPSECPFCSGGYGPTLEVALRRPADDIADGTEISLIGTLDLIEDSTTYQAARLIDARILGIVE